MPEAILTCIYKIHDYCLEIYKHYLGEGKKMWPLVKNVKRFQQALCHVFLPCPNIAYILRQLTCILFFLQDNIKFYASNELFFTYIAEYLQSNHDSMALRKQKR